jgi:hypothetical protein
MRHLKSKQTEAVRSTHAAIEMPDVRFSLADVAPSPDDVRSTSSVVAANWSLRTHVEALKPGHPYTFFSAKTAVTFIQSNAEPRGTLLEDQGPHADQKHKCCHAKKH